MQILSADSFSSNSRGISRRSASNSARVILMSAVSGAGQATSIAFCGIPVASISSDGILISFGYSKKEYNLLLQSTHSPQTSIRWSHRSCFNPCNAEIVCSNSGAVIVPESNAINFPMMWISNFFMSCKPQIFSAANGIRTPFGCASFSYLILIFFLLKSVI